ncbi:uncharacterized protein LOC134965111 [Pseudophryne corroboree]|uniref:uncharacterized protein LOC134965111 n=1 Tax=Pseudophryne corroboree TaxID=495146 RepID=UPI00308145DD
MRSSKGQLCSWILLLQAGNVISQEGDSVIRNTDTCSSLYAEQYPLANVDIVACGTGGREERCGVGVAPCAGADLDGKPAREISGAILMEIFTALLSPVCMPFPSRRLPCQNQTSDLLKLINLHVDYKFGLGHCPCAEGLVCTSKGNLISTCESPDEVIDFTNYRGDSLFPPLVHRDDGFIYYDTDLVPWPSQDEELAFVDSRREREAGKKCIEHAQCGHR